jgi:hypothetical protein
METRIVCGAVRNLLDRRKILDVPRALVLSSHNELVLGFPESLTTETMAGPGVVEDQIVNHSVPSTSPLEM